MKIWHVKGNWEHKHTNNVISMEFIVGNDGNDPIETINEEFDMSNMIYLNGEILEVNSSFAKSI